MNIQALLLLLPAGFGVSFLVMDISRTVGRRHWPVVSRYPAGNFSPFAVFLALFAGPALLCANLVRMARSDDGRIADILVGAVVACGWAGCYGFVVSRCVALLGAEIV